MKKNNSIINVKEKFVFQNHEKDKLEAELIIAKEELKRTKDHQKECIEGVEELLIIAHKFHQPITQILGLSILLTGSYYPQEDLKKIIDIMGKSAKSLDNFSRELTTFIHRKKLK